MEQEQTALLQTSFEDCGTEMPHLYISLFMTGGDSYGGETGFLGCMRNLYVQGFKVVDDIIYENVGNVINGSCDLQDRFAVFLMHLNSSLLFSLFIIIQYLYRAQVYE